MRRVERDLDLDPAGRAEEVHPLVRHELRRARERRLARTGSRGSPRRAGRRRSRGRRSSRPSTRVRLLAEDHPRRRDRVAADVVQAAAADAGDVADVLAGRALKYAERAGDDAQVADRAGLRELLRAQPLRVRARHERLADHDAGAVAHGEQLARLVGVEADRLLAQHVLAGLGRADRPRHVQVVRQRVVDRRRRRGRRAAPRTSRARARCRAGRPRRDPRSGRSDAIATTSRARAALHRGDHLLDGDVRRAEHAPADLLGHAGDGTWHVHRAHRSMPLMTARVT